VEPMGHCNQIEGTLKGFDNTIGPTCSP